MIVETPKLKCHRCGHQWTPRQPDVRICPKCKSASWDKHPKTPRSIDDIKPHERGSYVVSAAENGPDPKTIIESPQSWHTVKPVREIAGLLA